tara:strand:- start:817 stop:948 length:132 start_codon:yes stop_codon:yes gene_type:complete
MNLLERLTADAEEMERLKRQIEQLKAKLSLLNKIIESYEGELK